MSTRRIAIGLEYDGSRFSGFQAQRRPGTSTVQEALEHALSRVADEPITLVCAGRTDSGVHATGQVVHFDTSAERDPRSWVRGCNSLTDRAVTVHWALVVASDFHARFSATSRRYLYVWLDQPQPPAIARALVAWTYQPLDAERMHLAAQALVGEHDFSAFRASGCQSPTPFRRVLDVGVYRSGRLVIIDIRANAYLLHMVRNVAGALKEVGSGARPEGWIRAVLQGRDRSLCAPTAPPEGLYLVEVAYARHLGLPPAPVGPPFLV
ncbi:MAG: tRNA pseudouridine(38-40) synthase TruA [Pseudomonadales bacterium]